MRPGASGQAGPGQGRAVGQAGGPGARDQGPGGQGARGQGPSQRFLVRSWKHLHLFCTGLF